MSDRTARLIYAGICLALVGVLSALMGPTIQFSSSSGLWLEILLVVIFAACFMEPRYSAGPTVATNAVATALIAAGAQWGDKRIWWIGLLVVALLTLAFSVTGYLLDDSDVPERKVWARVLKAMATGLGTWKVLLLGALAIALMTFNRPLGSAWTVAAIAVLTLFALVELEPHRLIGLLVPSTNLGDDEFAVLSFYAPHELVLEGRPGAGLRAGQSILVRGPGGSSEGIVVETVAQSGRRAYRAYVPRLLEALPVGGVSSSVRATLADTCADELEAVATELADGQTMIMGTIAEGSRMREAAIELSRDVRVELGQVIWTLSQFGRTFWQVSDARVERTSWGGDARRAVMAFAGQVGRWDPDSLSFDADTRSPSSVEVAFGGDLQVELKPTPPGKLVIGSLPHSPFPVLVDLAHISRHHTAILGTTGTGKTHLAFALIESLADLGTKVICVDSTGQYSTRFDDAPPILTGQVKAFLDGDASVGIFTVVPGSSPITQVNKLARDLYKWATTQPALDPLAPARCLVVLEEAQNYIPETFVVDGWDLKAQSQDTSLVVMESRKYGLGFMILSQRTAMITKSALSQCNTVFAFQAVDQTGLDYIEGLCGPALARGVPTLPHRTAVVMGRGLDSATPLIARVSDASVVVA